MTFQNQIPTLQRSRALSFIPTTVSSYMKVKPTDIPTFMPYFQYHEYGNIFTPTCKRLIIVNNETFRTITFHSVPK